MIVDTSAIMAILLSEPERDTFEQALIRANHATISAGSWIELTAVLTRRKLVRATADLERLIPYLTIAPVTSRQAEIGREAYRRYGIGSGHEAALNFGDCFAYALAIDRGEPLLFKGDEFIHTDVRAAA